MDQRYPNLEQHAKKLLTDIQKKWSQLDQMYMREIERLRHSVIGIRRGMIEYKRIHEALDDPIKRELNKSIDDFVYDLNIIRKKEHFIADLSRKGFDYRNAIEYNVKNGEDEQAMERALLSGVRSDRIICFDDILYKQNQSQCENWIAQLLEEREKNRHLRFVFVDFSYCSYQLKRFLVLSKTEENNDIIASKLVETLPQSKRQKSDDTINILLLGEFGVGKSTFINAFANYLTFNRMEQAERKPVVLISGSFLMTCGNDFEEKRVTFGENDDLSNEDHDSCGQSVTQHCKSYVFTLRDDENRERKLRIIDTPGIGDVRSPIQNDINMQHVLLYMSNLTHLDAVCVLMKPNNACLNISLRSCFIQLFDLLGEDTRDKIIFCFTNSRATFYTPGNTGPLLKKLNSNLLKSLKDLREKYEDMRKNLLTEKKRINLQGIYQKLEEVNDYSTIKSQITVAKESQRLMMKYYEVEVPI